jgi:hypothetical protein
MTTAVEGSSREITDFEGADKRVDFERVDEV